MKTFLNKSQTLWLIAAMFAVVSVVCAQAQQTVPASEASKLTVATDDDNFVTVLERGANHKIIRNVMWTTDDKGRAVAQTNSFTELATGLHFQNEKGEWEESREEIEILPNGAGATARHGQHKVNFPPDIYDGQIELQTSEGQWLRSRVLGLSYNDSESGKSVLIAETTNSVGEVHGSNVVIYPEAFTDIRASLRLTYTKAGFEQDVVLLEQPPSPEKFGLNPETTRLQVLTEFFNPPQPEKREQTVTDSKGETMVDEQLNFGTLEMVPGKAFSLDQTEVKKKFRVSKQWLKLEGRDFLIEELKVSAVAKELEALPKARTALLQSNTNAVRQAKLGKPVLPVQRQAAKQSGSKPMRMAKANVIKSGFVMDYVLTLTGSIDSYILQSDSTYLVTGTFNVNHLTIEGGSVIKFDNNVNAKISVNNSVDCKTASYRPAVFTSRYDASVGELITPSGAIPSSRLFLGLQLNGWGFSTTPMLRNLRFSYAGIGVFADWTTEAILRDIQFYNCNWAISASGSDKTIHAWNILIQGNKTSDGAFDGLFDGGTIDAQHVTIHKIQVPFQGWDNAAFLNGLIVDTTYDPGTLGLGSANLWNQSGNTVFESVGGGQHYLPANSPHRNAGTLSINTELLDKLKSLTTEKPVWLHDQTISQNTIWPPKAQRDIDSPDRGYHYPALDYLVSEVTINAPLTLTNGIAVGVYGNYGLKYGTGGPIISQGNPANPNRVVWYSCVQEGSLGNITSGVFTHALNLASLSGTTEKLGASFRFTEFDTLSHPWYYHVRSGNNNLVPTLSFRDCEFHGGYLIAYDGSETLLSNCLFRRSKLWFDAGESPLDVTVHVRNCLFFNGETHLYGEDSWRSSFKDNLFHQTIIVGVQFSTHSHNGFTTSTGLGGAGEVVNLTPNSFLTGPLGDYYYPTTGTSGSLASLINGGSQAASSAGLYHFTTETSLSSKESTTQVDIGYHFVSSSANGLPLDTDNDGLQDWYEAELGTQLANPDTDQDGLSDGLEVSQLGTSASSPNHTPPLTELNVQKCPSP